MREANAIQTILASTGCLPITRLNDQEATVAAVLQCMKECNWIHLACHGVQDATSATDSAFLLIDGRLTLKETMKQSFSHTELAVLSACQTAKGDKNLHDEAIHLAAGMPVAGYGSVVASMWSIRDEDGPIIAEQFYKYLVEEGGGGGGRAAYALHNAVAHLRDVRGEKVGCHLSTSVSVLLLRMMLGFPGLHNELGTSGPSIRLPHLLWPSSFIGCRV